MAVYVDFPTLLTKGKCHLAATTLAELHEFAQRCGVKQCHFHRNSNILHYDLNSKLRVVAVAHGAIEVTSRELIKIVKRNLTPSNRVDDIIT